MNATLRQLLWLRLQEKRLVAGDLPGVDKVDSPWFVRVMLGVAGWIGSLFLLGFIGVAFSFILDNELAALIVGIVACVGTFFLFKQGEGNDFVTQFGLAIGLVGQMLILFGLFELFGRTDALLYAVVFVVEVGLTAMMSSFIYRVLSSLAAMIALSLALNSLGAYGVATGLTAAGFALIWLRETSLVRFGSICRPIGYGFALSLLLYQSGMMWGRGIWWPRSYNGANWVALYFPWLGKGLILTVFLAVVFLLLKQMKIDILSRSGVAVLSATVLIMAASFSAPGIIQALLLLLVGYAVCNRGLIGLGLFAFAAFFSNYYYTMQTTLLVKSMLLIGLGVVFLIGRLMVRQWLPAPAAGGKIDA